MALFEEKEKRKHQETDSANRGGGSQASLPHAVQKGGGPRCPRHVTHSERPRSAQASVHLFEYLLADHTLYSHLLKQKQILVIGQSKVTLGAQHVQGQEL